tara:strand:+ start:17288 stop:18859 length:1572 start_codon:yes stop_codon:yes gene_type:complete
LNGTIGIAVGTVVEVRVIVSNSGTYVDEGPFAYEWVFDRLGYGVTGIGAWVEITGHSSGAYSWKQKDPNATTDTVPAVTGANNAHTVNETEGIPNGTIVWLRFDGTDYRFEYDRLRFLAKITGESSGSYSWTELEGDGTTTTTRTGTYNAEEVSGRLGIPTNSVVDMIPNQIDSNEYKFEYHGALAGTLDTLNSGTSTTANADTWARDNQGGTLGEEHPFVARLTVDPTTGEMVVFDRVQEHDANGHEEAISAETKTIVGVLTPSTQTYEFVDCDTGLVTVARFEFADLPTDDYCWIHDGSDFVKCYNDGLSVGAATSPLPCILYMPTTPANCAATTFAAFDDAFDDSSVDTCKWTKTETGAGTVTETTKLALVTGISGGNSDAYLELDEPFGSSDFSVVVTYDNLVTTAGTGTNAGQIILDLLIGSDQVEVLHSDGGGPGATDDELTYVSSAGTPILIHGSSSSSGTFGAVRTGTSLAMKFNGSTVRTETISGDLTRLRIWAFSNSDAASSVNISNIAFTGG